MRDRVVGMLDIGGSKISCRVALLSDGECIAAGFGCVQSVGMSRGRIVSMQMLSHAIGDAISSAEKDAGMSVDSIVAAVPETFLETRRIEAAVRVKRAVHESDCAKLKHKSKDVIAKSVISYAIDGNVEIENPVGMSGRVLSADIYEICAKNSCISDIERFMRGLGLSNIHFVPSGIASALGVAQDKEISEEEYVQVVDFGYMLTHIAVLKGNRWLYSDCINMGGESVSKDISYGLGVSHKQAEKLKVMYGMEGKAIKIGDETWPRSSLRNIILPRLNEICALLHKKLSSFASKKIFIVGSSVAMHEIFTTLEKMGYIVVVPQNFRSSSEDGLAFYAENDLNLQSANLWKRFSSWLKEWL